MRSTSDFSWPFAKLVLASMRLPDEIPVQSF
jgi:hypothetical protein